MENRRWVCYVVVKSVLVCCIVAKSVSLNDIIEAESNQRLVYTATSSKIQEPEPGAERFTLNKELKPFGRTSKKFKEIGSSFRPLGKIISPLKYRKTFQIKSPLKPKKVKHSLRTRYKRKNQSVKREIDGNAILNRKYIPLLRSVGMLFDNILSTDSGESFEISKIKKRHRYAERIEDVTCKCASVRDSESTEKTITFSEAFATEVSVTTEASAKTADNTAAGDLRSIRQNKNVPVLLPRNTSCTRGNYNGLGERSCATHNRSAEGHISGDHGNSEHDPDRGEVQSDAQSYEEYTDNDPRDDASGVRSQGGIRGIRSGRIRDRAATRNNTEADNENFSVSKEKVKAEADILDSPRGHIDEPHGQNKYEARGDEAKSSKLLPEPVRKRGLLPEVKVTNITESVYPEEYNQESNFSVALNSSSDQRFFDRDGSLSSEVQEINTRSETLKGQVSDIDGPYYDPTRSTKTSRKGPVVVIIDGYSVTRHKNGENKLAEKTIRIRP